MAINLAEAFSKKVAEAFKQDSLTDSATGHDYSFSGTRTVRVWSVDTVPWWTTSAPVPTGTAPRGAG